MTVDNATILEYRIKKLFFYQGYFSRSHLSLRSYFYPDIVDVTDIDALGIRFTTNFSPETIICECKSGESEGTVDRILWLAGVSDYFAASNSMIVRKTIPAKIKLFAQEIRITPVDFERLLEIEKNNAIPTSYIGSNDYAYYEPRIKKIYQEIKDDPYFSKIYWLLRSKYWYMDNSTRMKQTITALEMLSADTKSETSLWLIYEAGTLFSLSLVYLCKELFSLTEKQRPEYINNLLITGVGSPEYSRSVLRAAYGLIATINKEKMGKSTLNSYGELKIPSPSYTDALIELIERMIQKPNVSIEVPRFLDFVCFEFLLKGKKIDEKLVKELFPSETSVIAKMGKNIAKFIENSAGISNEVYKNLMDF